MRKIYSANPDWKIRIEFFFLNNHKYSNGPSEMIMVLGFEISGNFGDCKKLRSRGGGGGGGGGGEINRHQRLEPFHSMPKPQKSKWGNDIKIMDGNCVMQPPITLHSPPPLSPPPLSSFAALLHHCPFTAALLCSSFLLLFLVLLIQTEK